MFLPLRPGKIRTTIRGRMGLCAVVVALVPLGCAPPDRDTGTSGGDTSGSAYTAVDDAGRTLTLSAPARRVVSLLPATTQVVRALDAEDRLVARTDYDEPELHHLPSVGGGLTPSLEVIASLQPDLVIAWEEAGSARVRPRLEALGIPVFAARTEDTTAIFGNIDRIGRLLGLDARSDSLASAIRRDLDRVRGAVRNRPTPSVLYLVSLDPPIIAGRNLFIGQMLEVAGGRNVFAELEAPSPQVSIEAILERRPEVVVVPVGDGGPAVIGRLERSPGWRDLITSGSTRVVTVPADIVHRPGPEIVQAAELLMRAIHPPVAGGGREPRGEEE